MILNPEIVFNFDFVLNIAWKYMELQIIIIVSIKDTDMLWGCTPKQFVIL